MKWTRFEWERIIRRVMIPATVKHVALTLATYADRNGCNARPSVARLAATTSLGERTVRRSLETLRALGLVERTFRGSSAGRQAMADVYRLTVPADLLDRVPMLPMDEIARAESAATTTGDNETTPVTETCDENGGNPVHEGTSAATVTDDVSGTPVTDAGTPVTDDRNTGHRDHPTLHDHPIINFLVPLRTPTSGITRARAVGQ